MKKRILLLFILLQTAIQAEEINGSLPTQPTSVIICQNSLLDLWYMAGGEAKGRVSGSTNVPLEAQDLPLIGSYTRLNIEAMMSLEPDLVIFTPGQSKEREFFESLHIPVLTIDYNNYGDFWEILDLFTSITDRKDIYETMVIEVEAQVESLIERIPTDSSPTICILFASPRYVKVETENSVAGYSLKLLGANNIYQENFIEGATRVNLSLEYILTQDPDYIFVTTMGDLEKSQDQLTKDITQNALWSELTAVKEGHYFFLDKSYSTYKPNRFYLQSFQILAQYLYPDVDFSLPTQETSPHE